MEKVFDALGVVLAIVWVIPLLFFVLLLLAIKYSDYLPTGNEVWVTICVLTVLYGLVAGFFELRKD